MVKISVDDSGVVDRSREDIWISIAVDHRDLVEQQRLIR